MSDAYSIDLRDLQSGVGLYSIDLCRLAHAAAVIAFDKASLAPPANCPVKDRGTPICTMSIDWSERLSLSKRRSLRNHADVARFAAEGIALLMVEALTDYTVVEQSQIGSGVDFGLGDKSAVVRAGDDDFVEATARLEVSGILRATASNSIRRRVDEKIEQIKQSDPEGTPAFIVIVEFGRPEVNFTERQPPYE